MQTSKQKKVSKKKKKKKRKYALQLVSHDP